MKYHASIFFDDDKEIKCTVSVRSNAHDETVVKNIAQELAYLMIRDKGISITHYSIEKANVWRNGGIWGLWLKERNGKSYQVYADREDGLPFIQ